MCYKISLVCILYTHGTYSNSQINTNAPPALPLPGQQTRSFGPERGGGTVQKMSPQDTREVPQILTQLPGELCKGSLEIFIKQILYTTPEEVV